MGLWDQFTPEARAWVGYAQTEAGRYGTYSVGAEHFLLALLREGGDDPALALLQRLALDADTLRERAERQAAGGEKRSWPPPPKAEGYEAGDENRDDFTLAESSKRLVEWALAEATRRERSEISPSYLLLGLIREDETSAKSLFPETGVTLESARKGVARQEKEAPPKEEKAPPSAPWWRRIFAKK